MLFYLEFTAASDVPFVGYCQARAVGKGGDGIGYSGGWRPYKPRAIAKHLVDRNVDLYGESDTEERSLTT